jgi:cytoskeletal protein RodZ
VGTLEGLGKQMRRVNVWLLVPAVLLALGVGVLIGQAGDDDSDTAASDRAEVLGQQFERDETTTTSEETTTTEAETTTTTAAVTTTTVQATTATTATATVTTAAPAVTTTTRRPAGDPNCGSGPAGASANLTVSGSGPPSDPVFTYTGPVTVTNNTGKAIELTSLVLRLQSSDGTVEQVAVAGAAGTVIENGVSRDFAFSHQSKHPPKPDGASVSAFAYKPPGGTRNCASI